MALLSPTPVSARHFSSTGDLYAAEASDIGLGHDKDFGRVWDDACDVGLTIIGKHRNVVYAVNHEERREGDLLWWDLRPADRRLDFLPTFRIFND